MSKTKIVVLLGFLITAVAGYVLLQQYLNFEFLANQEQGLKDYYESHPLIVLAGAFLIYFLITGLLIPGAAVMTLICAWFFGFATSTILISFASTAGATMAFLTSRYLFRDYINQKFGQSLETFQDRLEKEGAFYLFTLRLIPLVPFFVINAVMGLTKIKVTTFWWVSQLGMLAGTLVFCYAGSRIPNLQSIQEKGVNAVFDRSQMSQILIAFALLGLFPLAAKKLLGVLGKLPQEDAQG